MCCNTKLFTGKSEMFLGGGFYAYAVKGDGKNCCNFFPHIQNIWGEAWCLRNYCGINIADLPSSFANHFCGTQEKNATVDVRILCVTVRKMLTNISQGQSAQKGIANSVQKHVGIRVPQKSFFVGNGHSAQNQGSIGDKPMHVISVSNAKITHSAYLLRFR